MERMLIFGFACCREEEEGAGRVQQQRIGQAVEKARPIG